MFKTLKHGINLTDIIFYLKQIKNRHMKHDYTTNLVNNIKGGISKLSN